MDEDKKNDTLEGKQQEIDFLKGICKEQGDKIFEYKRICDLLKAKVDKLEAEPEPEPES
tara:strand:+ start:153 stop:329 length:177 start_codon:yes stop_codon:yes gene_type:complete